LAFNPSEPVSQIIVSQLVKNPKNDAIIRIPLGVAQYSENNNFSEVRVTRTPDPVPVPVPPDLPDYPPMMSRPVYVPSLLGAPAMLGAHVEYTTRQIVVGGGPRGSLSIRGI
jgi:hypothetical protein